MNVAYNVIARPAAQLALHQPDTESDKGKEHDIHKVVTSYEA
jgi:hypothetical protein